MTDVVAYRQRLDVLQANNDMVQAFVAAADGALFSNPTFGFHGYPNSGWEQRAGRPAPDWYAETIPNTARGLMDDVRQRQAVHSLAAGGKLTGLMDGYKFAQFVIRSGEDASGAQYQLRWFGVTGIQGLAAYTTADNYRFLRHEPGIAKTTWTLSHLGSIPVEAEYWMMPDDDEFAKRCFSAFPGKDAVDHLLSGNFRGQEDLDRLLRALVVTPETAELYDELRQKALDIRASNQMRTDFDLLMPNRDQLAEAIGRIGAAFI